MVIPNGTRVRLQGPRRPHFNHDILMPALTEGTVITNCIEKSGEHGDHPTGIYYWILFDGQPEPTDLEGRYLQIKRG